MDFSVDRKKVLLISCFVIVGAVGTGTVFDTNPDGYQLGVQTLEVTDVNQTKATFNAELTEIDEIYDAALIYWNYTDGEQEYKGPANISYNIGETVSGRQTKLDGDTGYNVEAYVEPIIWSDDTLLNNWAEIGLDDERPGAAIPANNPEMMDVITNNRDAMSSINKSKTGMDVLVGSSTAMDSVMSSRIAMDSVWGGSIDTITENNGGYIERTGSASDGYYDGGEYSSSSFSLVKDVNLEDKDTLNIDWSVYENDNYDGGYGEARVYVDGSRVHFTSSENGLTEINISSYSSRSNIEIQTYTYSGDGDNPYASVRVRIYDLWVE